MEERGDILLGPVGGLGFGGVVGLAVGFTAKKVGKLVLLGIGVVVALLQALAYAELVQIDWGAVEGAATRVWQTSDGTLADRAWEILTNNLPFGGGFVAGFALGFKMG